MYMSFFTHVSLLEQFLVVAKLYPKKIIIKLDFIMFLQGMLKAKQTCTNKLIWNFELI